LSGGIFVDKQVGWHGDIEYQELEQIKNKSWGRRQAMQVAEASIPYTGD
jgi:hypothetical protein